MHTYIYRYTHTYIYIYTYTDTHTHTHTRIHSHTHTYTHTHIYTHTFIFIYNLAIIISGADVIWSLLHSDNDTSCQYSDEFSWSRVSSVNSQWCGTL